MLFRYRMCTAKLRGSALRIIKDPPRLSRRQIVTLGIVGLAGEDRGL
jgi:hypothetical protein